MRKNAFIVTAVTALLVAASCDEPTAPDATADENNDFTVTLPDGTEVSGEDAYDAGSPRKSARSRPCRP